MELSALERPASDEKSTLALAVQQMAVTIELRRGGCVPQESERATADEGDFDSVTEGFDLVAPVSVTDRQAPEIVGAGTTTWVTPTAKPMGEPSRAPRGYTRGSGFNSLADRRVQRITRMSF